MNAMRWERLGPLTGIVAVALWVAGIIVLEGPGNQPNTDSPASEILSFFKDEDQTILAGTFLFMLGALFFLWFVGSLRAQLYAHEGGVGRLSATAAGGGLATGISLLLLQTPSAVGAINEKNLTAEAAQTFLVLDDAFFYAAELAAAVLLVATTLLIFRTGVLPRWLGWISALVALWLLIPPIGWAALIFAVPLWTIVVSLLLYAKPPLPPGPPPHTSQFVGTQ